MIALISIFCVSCGSVEVAPLSTSTPNFVTATFPPTSAPLPTQTALPPSPIPTNQPIEGRTTTQINVRVETTTASESLGVVSAFSTIQVIGKESSGNWYQVIYENGAGWVRAEFVQVDASVEIPVVGIESASPLRVSGVVKSGINVRSGPGTQFDSIGVLTQNDVVLVRGKNESGTWMQINFAGETGWVATEFLQTESVEEIPVIGVVENTPTPPMANETPFASVQLALQDNDSLQTPLVKTFFTENKILQIQGDVSAPQGDLEDWVEFLSFTSNVVIEATCSNNSVQIELWKTGNLVKSFQSPCSTKTFLNLLPNESYTLRIFQPNTNENTYTSYTLKMKVVR